MAKKLVVIGAGVAGIFASATAAALGVHVTLFEKMEKPLRKLRISGKGRCNISNTAEKSDFLLKLKSGAEFFEPALENFNVSQALALLDKIGIPTTVERGNRVFPTSGSAPLTAETLVRWAKAQGVDIQCNSPVVAVSHLTDGVFKIETDKAVHRADYLLITTGGVSYPATGSSGDGHEFAFEMGHKIVPLRPALVPLVIAQDVDIKQIALKNIAVKLLVDQVEVENRFGDVEFTDRGLAGAVILQLSRTAVDAILNRSSVTILLDLKSALSQQKILGRIERDLAENPSLCLGMLLRKLTPSALHSEILHQSQLSAKQRVSAMSLNEREILIRTLKNLRIPIVDYRPFSEAIITAGGVDLGDIDCNTMQSKVVENLYFAGEILDLDADTGGFNIQIAISTAILAAQQIAK